MKRPEVSIVIPIFNVAPFLEKCLNSALRQTRKSIEIIAIDDASTDSSRAILENYARNDSRIRVLRNEKNRGTFATRARGVLESSGKYILNLDGDDELFPEILEKIYPIAETQRADILHFRMKNFSENPQDLGHFGGYGNPKSFGALEGFSIAKALLEEEIHMTPWGKLIRGEIYRKALRALDRTSGVLSQRILCYEDFLHMAAVAVFAKRYLAIEDVGYKYIAHENSLMATWRQNDQKILSGLRDLCSIVSALDLFLGENLPEMREFFRKSVQWRAVSWAKRPRSLENGREALQIVRGTKIFIPKTLRKIKNRLRLKFWWRFWQIS